ncbi:endoplasmic reticulum aminopeptidase 2-like isoform X2 [Adelges cooleyi]|uniref:endoplasmic reticulum aminopeptidase 2-like isoform X2 n=1 Tax=Adelges cooleyi TaxID=133065 RepID=UPI0021804F47|nr:endoplasmic reticulum aminopeptidase 2-like isoform X2 [Adelges cooleyi]
MTATIIPVILLLACNSVFGIHGSVKNGDGKMDVFELPNDIGPESYDLTINPIFTNFTFQGDVTIVIVIKAHSTKVITLNSKDLSIVNVSVSDVQSSRPISVANIVEVPKNEQLEIHVKEHLVSGLKYVLKISFAGKLRDDKTGFYKSSHIYERKDTRWSAITHFYPKYARRAFPCFDEPSIKVPFKISVMREYYQRASSNMPLSKTDYYGDCVGRKCDPGSKVYDRFETTPPISTNLVSFYVGEFPRG